MKKIIALLILSLFATTAQAEVKVDPMFGDQMVLQQEMPVPVWGTADAGEKVTVAFCGQKKETTACKEGKWSVKLDALKLGKPGVMTVSGKENKVEFKDVLVGEVWVGSGQSNMAGGTGGYARRDAVLDKWSKEEVPNLRLYIRGRWEKAGPNTSKSFSAIAFAFAYSLQKELKVPVGVMVSAQGGQPSGRWITPAMAADSCCPVLKSYGAGGAEKVQAAYEAALKKWQAEKAKAEKAGKKFTQRGPRRPIKMGDLYVGGVEKFVPYAIRGVLWDQGESRTAIPEVDQITAMTALINGWRKAWDQGDFHFLHVQKPSGGGPAWDPSNPVNTGAVKFTEQPTAPQVVPLGRLKYPLDHVKIATLKNAPIVTAIDLGPGIHPSCKSGYGARACRVALGSAYGKDVAICGPTYKSHKAEGNKIRVSFDNLGKGLAYKHGKKLQGFEVAGADGKWDWAEATIDGDSVVLVNAKIAKPLEVRYGVGQRPSYANLFNKDGLPALLFTTQKE